MQANKRRITIADLKSMAWVSDPQLSPNGRYIAYVVKQADPEDDKKYISRLWLVDVDTGKNRAITQGPKSDSNPRWSPDGTTLAFTSNRGDKNQVWLLPMDGGEARQLSKRKDGAGTPLWSPDGKKIAYVARVAATDETDSKDKSDVKIITRLHYKMNGMGFLGDRYSQIFVIDAETGEERQVTSGDYNAQAPTWSPCSGRLAFSSNRTEEPEYNNLADIWTVSVDGTNLQAITRGEGPSMSPSWSPCGRYIAYLGHKNEYKSATLSRLLVIPAEGGPALNLTENFDREPGNSSGSDMVAAVNPGLIWSKDSEYLHFLASDGPRTKVYRVKREAGAPVEAITDNSDRVIYGLSMAGDGQRLALAITSPTEMGDIYLQEGGGPARRLTEHNRALWDELLLSKPECFTVMSDGMKVDGWIMKPIGFREGVKYPAVLQIHGGPHVSYGYTFMHEFQVLAASGYAVFYTNPPGSQAYGQEFVIKTHHDWGGADYRGVMAAVDHVSGFDYVDEERLALTGGSYGGYLTNWIIGQDQRFKAAVTQRSTCNRYSMFGTSDVGFMNGQFEFMENPWDNQEFYLERSPISYVNNIHTPLLILHSEQDLRCPIEQAEQFYTALKWLRREATLVRFPDENHELSRSGQPRHRLERLNLMVDWFKKYVPTKETEYLE